MPSASKPQISPEELQEALRLAHYTVDSTELSGAGLVARALLSTQEQLEALQGAARVVVQEFAADNPFVGYSVEALADVLGEPNPMRGAPNPASSRFDYGEDAPNSAWAALRDDSAPATEPQEGQS